MKIQQSAALARWLLEGGLPDLVVQPLFRFDDDVFATVLAEVKAQHPHLAGDEAAARAAYRLLSSNKGPSRLRPKKSYRWLLPLLGRVAKVVWCLLVLLLLAAIAAKAQGNPVVHVENQGAEQGLVFIGPFRLNCSTNMSCTWDSANRRFNLTASTTAGSAWSSITAPTANLFINHGNLTTSFQWGSATGAGANMLSFFDTASNTGTGYVLSVNTASGSAAKPIRFTAGGTANGVEMTTAGLLQPLGSGGLSATHLQGRSFAGTAPADGQLPIWNNVASQWQPSDPIVSGPDAPGAAPTRNPVQIGGYDGANVQRVRTDASGFLGVNVQNTPSVSAAQSGSWSVTASAGAGTFTTDPSDRTARVLGRAFLRNPGDTANMGDATTPVRTDPTGTTTQPVSGTVTANQGGSNWSANVAQFGGSAVVTGTGVSGAGIPRVTLSNDSSLAANQSVNLAQMAGNTTLTGNGVTGTGSQRETIASDNSNAPGIGAAATGSAVPSGAHYIGGDGTGNLTGYIACDNFAIQNALATSGNTQLVALTSGQIIYVCGFAVNGASTTLNTVKLVYGTGTACGTGQTDMSVQVPVQAPASIAPSGQNVAPPMNVLWKTAASNALCVNLSAAQAVNLMVWWTKF